MARKAASKPAPAAPTPPGAGKIIAPTGFGGWDTWDIARGVVVDSAPTLIDALKALVANEPLVAAGAGAVVFYPLGLVWPSMESDAEDVWNCREFLVVPDAWRGDPHGRTPRDLPAAAAAIAIATQTGDMDAGRDRITLYQVQDGRWPDAELLAVSGLGVANEAQVAANAKIADAIVAGAQAAEVVRLIAGIAAGFDVVPGSHFPPRGLSWIMPVGDWRRMARRARFHGLVQSGRVTDAAAGFLGNLSAVVRVRSSGLGVDQVFGRGRPTVTSTPLFTTNRTLYLAFGPDGTGPIVQVASDRPSRVVVSVIWPGLTSAVLTDDRDEHPFADASRAARAIVDATRVAQALVGAIEVAEFRNALAIAFDRAAAGAAPSDARLVDAVDAVGIALGLEWGPKAPPPTPAMVDPATGGAVFLSDDVVQSVEWKAAGPYGRAGALDALVEAVTGDPAPWRGAPKSGVVPGTALLDLVFPPPGPDPVMEAAAAAGRRDRQDRLGRRVYHLAGMNAAADALGILGERSLECRGHPSDPEDGLARTVYCDGSCRPPRSDA